MQGDVDVTGADDGHNAGSVGANITRMRGHGKKEMSIPIWC